MAKNRKNDIYRNEFLSHLHEQYAINDNDKSKTFVSLLTSIFVIFGTYGYVLGHYITKAPLLTSSAYDEEQILTIIWGMSNVISLILLFLSIYVVIIGYSTRRDHIVITNIREKVFGKKYEEYFPKEIFSAKNKDYCDFIPNYYNLFYWTFLIINLLVSLTTICLFFKNNAVSCCCCSNYGCCKVCVCINVMAITIGLSLVIRNCYHNKYEKFQENFRKSN